MYKRILAALCLLLSVLACSEGSAAELLVGAASAGITPDGPVAVSGQFRLRIARKVETPITANVVALESRRGDESLDAAVMVSCDLLYIPTEVLRLVREAVGKRLPDLDTRKIFLGGTHTHTAPVLVPGKYAIPKKGVMQVEAYRAFFVERVSEAVIQAWKNRKPGSVTWGLGHAVVAYNRRAAYADGSARMYGGTDTPAFRSLEGFEDHDVGTLFFWNTDGQLIAAGVNVSGPSRRL